MNAIEKFVRHGALELISTLHEDSDKLWGNMTPQHMVEHIAIGFDWALGESEIPMLTPEEKIPAYQAFLRKDKPFKPMTKAPFLDSEELPDLEHPNLETAKKVLGNKIEAAFEDFKNNPELQVHHPIFGTMGYELWLLFQVKHLNHHCIQFGLMPVPNHRYFEAYLDQ